MFIFGLRLRTHEKRRPNFTTFNSSSYPLSLLRMKRKSEQIVQCQNGPHMVVCKTLNPFPVGTIPSVLREKQLSWALTAHISTTYSFHSITVILFLSFSLSHTHTQHPVGKPQRRHLLSPVSPVGGMLLKEDHSRQVDEHSETRGWGEERVRYSASEQHGLD